MATSLQTSRPKKGKGKAKPSSSKVVVSAGEDLSYLPPIIMVLGSSLCNMPLETNARVPLKPIRSMKLRAPLRARLSNEIKEEAKGGDEATLRPKRRIRQQVSKTIEVSFEEGILSVEPLEIPKAALKVREDSGSAVASLSLREVFKLLREGLVEKPGFDSIKALITLARLRSSPIKDMVVRCLCTKATLLQSLWHSLKVRPRHIVYCYFSLLFSL